MLERELFWRKGDGGEVDVGVRWQRASFWVGELQQKRRQPQTTFPRFDTRSLTMASRRVGKAFDYLQYSLSIGLVGSFVRSTPRPGCFSAQPSLPCLRPKPVPQLTTSAFALSNLCGDQVTGCAWMWLIHKERMDVALEVSLANSPRAQGGRRNGPSDLFLPSSCPPPLLTAVSLFLTHCDFLACPSSSTRRRS